MSQLYLGGVLLEKFLCLVDLGGKVGASASIGMVQKHKGSVGFADFVLGEGTLAEVVLAIDSGGHCHRIIYSCPRERSDFVTWEHLRER